MYKLHAFNEITQCYDIELAERDKLDDIMLELKTQQRFYHDLRVTDRDSSVILIRTVLDERDAEAVMDLIPPICLF